jgi:hypothetical protein
MLYLLNTLLNAHEAAAFFMLVLRCCTDNPSIQIVLCSIFTATINIKIQTNEISVSIMTVNGLSMSCILPLSLTTDDVQYCFYGVKLFFFVLGF